MPGSRPIWWPGETHEAFTQWSVSQGVCPNGVSPARFPGRGIGMIATRKISEGEVIVTVPLRAMLTVDSIPRSFVEKFTNPIPVQALIAAFLTHGEPEDLDKYALWKRVWPTRQDFEASMPILWPTSLRDSNSASHERMAAQPRNVYLPPSISGQWNSFQKQKVEHPYESFHQNLLDQQEERLRFAWECVLDVFPSTDWEAYSYYWLIVNTRSFYYLVPGEKPPEDRNDAMALLPFADYFNHSDMACDVHFDGASYSFRATKSYEEGEEIFMSYGPHPNDFLFAEYGFFLEENESDVIYLDDIIFSDLRPFQREELHLQEYYGDYQLTASGACYRTEIAAGLKYMSRRDWRNYVLGHSTKGENAKKTRAMIREWILAYMKEADTVINALKAMESAEAGDPEFTNKVDMLLKRWRQIKILCDCGLQSLSD